MFGFGRDKRQKKLDELLGLIDRADDEAKADFLMRLGGAANLIVKEVSDGFSLFSDMKLALKPDQANQIANKVAELEASVQRQIQEMRGGVSSVDALAFRMLEVSLRHKAGEGWITADQSHLVDVTIATAEQIFNEPKSNEIDGQQVGESSDLEKGDLRLSEATRLVDELAFNITPYGTGVALLSLESGYSPAETASQIAVATFALDARETRENADIVRMMSMSSHAAEVIQELTKYKDNGLMREEIWKNDGMAIYKVTCPSEEQESWISQVLSDPVISKERLAVSRTA
ncbi:MAG: hypothetical protein AAGJ28_15925 [Pseudomonadota bacterium]